MWFLILNMVFTLVFLLFSVAYFTLLERKVLAGMQRRNGPAVAGICGFLQPLSDGLNLMINETILPSSANLVIFLLSPILTFILSFMGWIIIPFHKAVVIADINVGILYLLSISSLGVYGIIMAGWSSNSNYSFLGALRSTAQLISYEISVGLIVMSVLVCSGSLNLTFFVLSQIGMWYFLPLFPAVIVFFISILAETSSSPFDLPEAEAELVSGYNVEYSAVGFVLFFIAEYLNIIAMSIIFVILFLGGWLPCIFFFFFSSSFFWLGLNIVVILYIFVWVRASLPSYRYDQLMLLGWKIFLPMSLGWIVYIVSLLLVLDGSNSWYFLSMDIFYASWV